MAAEASPGPAQPGEKRHQGTALSWRMYEYRRVPPLMYRVPVKTRRTQVGLGVKSSFSPHKGARKSHLPREQIKLQPEELHSIRGELSQIRAQVERLLENLECMDQQRDQLPGQAPPTVEPGRIPRSEDSRETKGPGSKGSSRTITDLQQEPRGQSPHPEADSSEDSTDPEEAGKNHASDPQSSRAPSQVAPLLASCGFLKDSRR